MNCKDCLPLIPSYLDEELSEAQAAPLRQHLMDCRLCRKTLSGEKAFKRWFEHEPLVTVAVPAGFAARVARRAFAGDTGSGSDADRGEARKEEAPLLQFVLWATAIAAGFLLVVSLLIFQAQLPTGDRLHADRAVEKEDLLEDLKSLQDPAFSTQAPRPSAGAALKDMAEESTKAAAGRQDHE
jgi:hypothetical protein